MNFKNKVKTFKVHSDHSESDSSMKIRLYPRLRGCLHDNGATFIPGRDEKLHRVYIKPCLLGCESYSAVKLKKLSWI